MDITSSEIESSLKAAVPAAFHTHCTALASILAEAIEPQIPAAEMHARLLEEPGIAGLLSVLAGRTVGTGASAFSFGAGNHVGTVTLGEVAGRDIIKIAPEAIIKVNFSAILQPAPRAHLSAVLRLIQDYKEGFGGREHALAFLDSFLEQDERPYALLFAPTGRGKTALLVHWAERVQAAGGWTVVYVPISRRYGTARAEPALGLLAHALASFHGESLAGADVSPDQLRPRIADDLSRRPASGGRVLIILDGLDEAVGWKVGRDLFPHTPPPHLRVLVSTRQTANKSDIHWLDELGWDVGQVLAVPLPKLRKRDVVDVLRQLGNPIDILSNPDGLLDRIWQVSQGDPLTLRFLVEAVRDGSLAISKLQRLPRGLAAYMKDWIDELLGRLSESNAVYTLLGLCGTALGPLADGDLRRLAPRVFSRKGSLLLAAREVDRFIMGDGSSRNGYVFSHPRLQQLFVQTCLSREERGTFRRRFVSAGTAWYRQQNRPLSDYLRQFWVSHLAAAGRWELARQVLIGFVEDGASFRQPWAASRFSLERSYAGYLSDLDLLWQRSDDTGDTLTALTCALISASVRSLSGCLPPELLGALVAVGTPQGRWSAPAALQYVRLMPDAWRQRRAISNLSDRAGGPLDQAVLDTVLGIEQESHRARTLAEIAPRLHLELIPEGLAAAENLHDPNERAEALLALAIRLPASQQRPWLLKALRSVQYKDELELSSGEPSGGMNNVPGFHYFSSQIDVLARMIPYLPADLLAEALEFTRTSVEPFSRARLLAVFAGSSPVEKPALWAEALQAARAVVPERPRALALAELFPELPDELIPEALQAARDLQDCESRAAALVTLHERVPPEARAEIMAAARALPDTVRRQQLAADGKDLVKGPYTPVRASAIRLPDAGSSGYHCLHARAFAALAPLLPPHETLAVWDKTFQALKSHAGSMWHGQMLVALAPHVPEELLLTVLHEGRQIGNGEDLAKLLETLAIRLPQHELPRLLGELNRINYEPDVVKVLTVLAHRLPDAAHRDALDKARELREPGSRALALIGLAVRLSPGRQRELYQEALDTAQQIGDLSEAADLGIALLPNLPATSISPILDTTLRIPDNDEFAKTMRRLLPSLTAEQRHLVRVEATQRSERVVSKDRLSDQLAILLLEDAENEPDLRSPADRYFDAVLQHLDAPDTRQLYWPDAMLEWLEDIRRARRRMLLFAAPPELALTSLAGLRNGGEAFFLALELTERLDETKRQKPWAGLLAFVHEFDDVPIRARLLAILVERLGDELLPQARAEADTIPEGPERQRVGVALALRGALPGQPDPLDLALAIADEELRNAALLDVIPSLQPERLAELFENLKVDVLEHRASVLAAIAARSPASLQPQVLTATNELPPEHRLSVLRALASAAAPEVFPELLESLQHLIAYRGSAEVLASLTRRLTDDLRLRLWEFARQLEPGRPRVVLLTALVPGLVGQARPETARDALSQLAPVLEQMSHELRQVGQPDSLYENIASFAASLPQELLPEAVRVAAMAPDSVRDNIWSALSTRLEEWVDSSPRDARAAWHHWARRLASRGRPSLIRYMTATEPWLMKMMGTQSAQEIVAAVWAVCRCWT